MPLNIPLRGQLTANMSVIKKICTLSAAFVLIFAAGCNKAGNTYKSIDGFAQGGTFHLVYKEVGQPGQYNLPDSLTKWFGAIDKSLSGYDCTSITSRINRGENPPLDSLFIGCFNLSREVWEKTGGKFDISAAPFFDIWGFGFRNREQVSQEKIDSIMAFVGMEKLHIRYDSTANASFLVREDPRMKVNFNAIAQGYTCDYICRELEKAGITDYLLEVGGEILCKGKNAKGKDWSVGIDKPVDGNFIPGQTVEAVIEVSGKGLVTSGNYRKFYIEDGEKFSHTIDPKTGYPVRHNLLSATVIAPTAALADAYATYLMVIGLEPAKKFLQAREEMDALLVYGEEENLKVYATEGVRQRKLK